MIQIGTQQHKRICSTLKTNNVIALTLPIFMLSVTISPIIRTSNLSHSAISYCAMRSLDNATATWPFRVSHSVAPVFFSANPEIVSLSAYLRKWFFLRFNKCTDLLTYMIVIASKLKVYLIRPWVCVNSLFNAFNCWGFMRLVWRFVCQCECVGYMFWMYSVLLM